MATMQNWSMMILSIVLLKIICKSQQKNTSESRIDVEEYTTELINKLLPKGYNKNLRPNYGGMDECECVCLSTLIIDKISL